MMSLGSFIQKARESRGMSLRDVEAATKGAISNAYVSQIETGKVKEPSLVMLHRLAAALCVPFEEMTIAAMSEHRTLPSPPICETCGQLRRTPKP